MLFLIKMESKHIRFFVERILELRFTTEWNQSKIEKLTGLEILGVYGVGTFGLVLKAKRENKTVAIKLTAYEPNAIKEFEIQKLFAKYRMSPILYDYQVYTETVGSRKVEWVQAVMDPIQSTLFENIVKSPDKAKQLSEAVECLVKKKYLLGIIHGDMHANNVVILNDGKTLGFIDFGLAREQKNPSEQLLDGITLLGSLKNTYDIFDPQSKVPVMKPGIPSKYLGFYELVLGIFNFYEKMFSIILDWSKFRLHPSHAYVYFEAKSKMLHSYTKAASFPQSKNWGKLVNVCMDQEIRKVFPDIRPPKIVD